MLPRAPFVEYLPRPTAKRLGAEREQSMKLMKEPGQHPANIGDDFVGMRAHQAARMHHDAKALCSEPEAIPVALFELAGLVRIEEEVAAGGAPGKGPSRTGFDDASSGHARGEERKACRPELCGFSKDYRERTS